jgi:hypothetical protein
MISIGLAYNNQIRIGLRALDILEIEKRFE